MSTEQIDKTRWNLCPVRFVVALTLMLSASCNGCWDFRTQSDCGNRSCDGSERCETCPQDCGQCNVCGDGRCSVTEVENCATCKSDCACPDFLSCARELSLPPRCVFATQSVCPHGQAAQRYTFCLLVTGARLDDCANRYETSVVACTKEQATQIAQNGAANYTVKEGECPKCCAKPPCS